MKRLISVFSALLLLCQASFLPASAESSDGKYYDYRDEANGIYYDENGDAHPIDNVDEGSDSSASSGGGMVVSSSDGSVDITPNADGSITVESGQIQVDIPTEGGSSGLTDEEFWAKMNKYLAANGTTDGTLYVDEKGDIYVATLNTLGLGRSTITVGGQQKIVPTSSLTWESEAPEDQQLAVVTPAKQSYLTLRAKKSSKSWVMAHCDKCEVLRVINVGKTWTMVDHLGDKGWMRGYVMTSGLTFYDNKPKTYAAGIITINGKVTRSGDTVHVRSLNNNKSRQIAEYPMGTPVTVFSQDDQWSEIDVEGLHCYILNKFVTLQEPLLIASAEENTEGTAED